MNVSNPTLVQLKTDFDLSVEGLKNSNYQTALGPVKVWQFNMQVIIPESMNPEEFIANLMSGAAPAQPTSPNGFVCVAAFDEVK